MTANVWIFVYIYHGHTATLIWDYDIYFKISRVFELISFFFWKSLTVLDIISIVKTIYFRQKYNICSLLRWPINRWNLKIDTYLFGYIFRIFLKIICKFTTAGEYRWKSHTFEIIELYLPLVQIHQNLFHDFSYQLYYILQTYMEFKNANGF